MSRIYWDTMLFVYWLENHPVHAKRVQHILSKMEERQTGFAPVHLQSQKFWLDLIKLEMRLQPKKSVAFSIALS